MLLGIWDGQSGQHERESLGFADYRIWDPCLRTSGSASFANPGSLHHP